MQRDGIGYDLPIQAITDSDATIPSPFRLGLERAEVHLKVLQVNLSTLQHNMFSFSACT